MTGLTCREVIAATRVRQCLGTPHQKQRKQRHRCGDRGRQQQRRGESMGEGRIADLLAAFERSLLAWM
jgi:hypothetical protein